MTRRLLAAFLLWLGLLGQLAAAQPAPPVQAPPEPPEHILLLYAYGYGGRGVELFSEGFFAALTEAGFPVTNVHAEYLDLQRHRDLPGYRAGVRDLLARKYGGRRIDLIVTLQQPALDFLLTEGRDLAPQAPVIAIQQRQLLEAERQGRRIVGEVNQFDIRGTLERALELFPRTRRIVFASGSSAADLKVVEEALRIAEPWRDRLALETTTGKTLDEILQRVASLPADSIVVFTQYNVDAAGRVALAYEAERMIVKAANAPVFGFYDYNLKNGGIGGSVIPVEASGRRTGRLALSLLRGDADAVEGSLRTAENLPMFDWQQIERWGGAAGRLPADAVFINRLPSVWQDHGATIAGTLLFILAESLLIAALVANIRRRRHAERVLAESEANFRAIFLNIFDAVIFTDADRRIRLVNPAFTRLFGYTAGEAIGHTTEFVYADPADYADQGHRRFHRQPNGESGIYELRYRRKDGSEFWAESAGTRILDADGTVVGLMSMHRDITERRRVAADAQASAAALLDAQAAALEEQRRARLAALSLMEDAMAARQRAEAANVELSRFNRASVGRELDMIALKKQINALSRELGRAPPFPLAFVGDEDQLGP